MKDAVPRTRETTYANKRYLFDKKVLPHFGEMPISAIKPTDIRNWQNELINYRQPNGRGYAPTYLRTINNQLTAAFNFAVKFLCQSSTIYSLLTASSLMTEAGSADK